MNDKTIRIFQTVKNEILERFPWRIIDAVRIDFTCPEAIYDHVISRRQYAHCFCASYPSGNTICVAPAIEHLAEKYIAGIIWHEFGHIIAGPESGERIANKTIYENFGIKIKYTKDKRRLEYVI